MKGPKMWHHEAVTKQFPSLCLAFLLLTTPLRADSLFIKRVVDGDTVLLSNGEKVRLIGVDTPEVHASQKLNKDAERSKRSREVIRALGKQSSQFVKQVAEGRPARLEYEKSNKVSGHQDRYNRTLAYVYFTPKTAMIWSTPWRSKSANWILMKRVF
jgi:endonuclease YncB( thermonuclease family)